MPSHSYQLALRDRKRWPEPGEGVQVSVEHLKEQHQGIPATLGRKSASPGAWLESCILKKAGRMGRKQEKQTNASLQGYDLIGILRKGGMAPVSGGLEWKGKGTLWGKGRGDELPCLCCPVCWLAGVHGPLPGHGWGADWRLLGNNEREGSNWCHY